MSVDCDVICIGAGPSGAIASALLVQAGYSVIVLERQQFPRFSIGESLLPQCMAFVEEAGMLEAVQAGNFQFKNGAAFERGTEHTFFNFEEKFTPGPGTTFQVQRAAFDKILADEAQRFGADIRYGHEILEADFSEVVNGEVQPRLTAKNPDGTQREYRCRFVLDASGFGRCCRACSSSNRRRDFRCANRSSHMSSIIFPKAVSIAIKFSSPCIPNIAMFGIG